MFSSGTWRAEDGVVAGFGRGDTLHANGYFQFGADDTKSFIEGRLQEDVLAEFETQFAGSNAQFFRSTFDGFSRPRVANEFFDSQGREYLVGGNFQGEDLLIVRLLSDGSVDPSLGENGLLVIPLEPYTFPATENTIANWERNGSIGPRPVTQTVIPSISSTKLAFDSEGGIGIAMAILTGDNLNFPGNRSSRVLALGHQIIQLDADGNPDLSFSEDGIHTVEFLPGNTVRLNSVSFNANDELQLTGRKLDQVQLFLLGNLSGVAEDLSTLKLVETSPGEFALVDA